MALFEAPSIVRSTIRRLGSVLLAAVIAGVIALWIFSGDQSGEANVPTPTAVETTPSADAPIEVGVLTSSARDLVYELPLRGYTEASRTVNVQAETGGLVISPSVPKGTVIAAGDVLCEIAPGDRPALLAQAKARVAQAEADARSAETLAGQGFGSRTAANAAEASLAAAHAEVERITLDIERTVIKAPFEGVLETDSAQPGSLLQPGALCATVIDLDPVHVVGFAPERAIHSFAAGEPAAAELSTGQRVIGTISFVARAAEVRTRTFRIELTANNPDYQIRDGLSAEILIPISRPDAHLVPQSALTLNRAGELGLRLVVDGRARFAPVHVLRDAPDGVWVDGLPTTADIIVVGQEFAADGVVVRPVPVPDISLLR